MARTLDLTNTRFNRLVAIRKDGKDKQGNILWMCACDCGGSVVVAGSKLKNGNTKSCGCYKRDAIAERNKEKLIDLTGGSFGRLQVIDRGKDDANGNIRWNCICQCGNKALVSGGNLRDGSTKSCGCIKKDIGKEMVIDIKGKKFSRLTAIRMVGFDNGRRAKWEFLCDCGKRTIAVGYDVRAKKTKSCGCLQKEIYEDNKNDVIGKRFGRLMVIRQVESKNRRLRYECICNCGEKTVVLGQNLVNSHTISCGCYGRENLDKIHQDNIIHGMIDTPEYQSWGNMKARCNNPNTRGYHNYGGRGITYDPRWEDFENFLEDMGPKPHPDLTIERLDNYGNYEPSNCVWETRKTQANNRRTKEECLRDRGLMQTA